VLRLPFLLWLACTPLLLHVMQAAASAHHPCTANAHHHVCLSLCATLQLKDMNASSASFSLSSRASSAYSAIACMQASAITRSAGNSAEHHSSAALACRNIWQEKVPLVLTALMQQPAEAARFFQTLHCHNAVPPFSQGTLSCHHLGMRQEMRKPAGRVEELCPVAQESQLGLLSLQQPQCKAGLPQKTPKHIPAALPAITSCHHFLSSESLSG